jgi:hypothetical protein
MQPQTFAFNRIEEFVFAGFLCLQVKVSHDMGNDEIED